MNILLCEKGLQVVVTVWTIVSIISNIVLYLTVIDSLCISLEYSLACLLHVFSMCYPCVFSLFISSVSQLLSVVVKFTIIIVIEYILEVIHKIPRVITQVSLYRKMNLKNPLIAC